MPDPTPLANTLDTWAAKAERARAAAIEARGPRPGPSRLPTAEEAARALTAPTEDERREAVTTRQWSSIPTRFTNARPDQLGDSLATLHAKWVAGGMTSNVLLLGNVGVGKTHAAVAFLRTAAEAGRSIRFAPVVELLDQLRPGAAGSGEMDRALRPDVLVLDDLGGEKPTDWTAERLYAVVNRRWLEERPTIATSNIDAEALEQTIGSRTWSRLFHGALRLKIAGADRRRAS